jgi:hypothetical protein
MAERATATRDRLMSAAMALFAERGFDGASIGTIERAAGLAPARARSTSTSRAARKSCCAARSSASYAPSTSSAQ